MGDDSLLALVTRTGEERDESGIVACMREHGICVIPAYYSTAFVDTICQECEPRVDEAHDIDFPDGSYRRVDVYQGTAAAANERLYHVDCFSKHGGLFRQDPFLKAVASSYYGSPHSVHVCIYERHRHHEIPVRGFHVDTFEASTFKVMLYLSDVGPDDGPTSYIIGSHRDAQLRYNKEHVWGPAVSPGDPSGRPHPTNFTDEELGPWLERHVAVTGERGTIVLFDTWGVHKGLTPAIGRERHVLVNYYRQGADLPRSDFGYDAKADYQRYAVDYKKYTGVQPVTNG